MSNKQIAALMAVRAFAGTNTVSADNNFADGVAAANRHVINHIDYLITQVQAGHEVPFVVEHESRFPFQGKVTSEPQLADRHALQAEGKHPAPCARFCEANAFKIEIRQLSAQLEQADRQRVPQWRPIETAPKDGRLMLLGYVNRAGNWRTLRGKWFSAQAIADEWSDDEAPEGWYEVSVECESDTSCWATTPTHWMPLPAAPDAAPEAPAQEGGAS